MSILSRFRRRPAAVVSMLALALPSCEPSVKPEAKTPLAPAPARGEGTWHTISYHDLARSPSAKNIESSSGWNWSPSMNVDDPSGGPNAAPAPLVMTIPAGQGGNLQTAMAKMADDTSKPEFTLRGGSDKNVMRNEIAQQRREIKALVTDIEDRQRAAAAAAGVPQPVIEAMPRSSSAHPVGGSPATTTRAQGSEPKGRTGGRPTASSVPNSPPSRQAAINSDVPDADLHGDLAPASGASAKTTAPATSNALESALRPMIKAGTMALVRPERGAMSCDDCAVLINGVNTTYDELLEESRALANRLARPIIAIYNPTQGIVRDVINATRSLDEELARPDRECVKLISEVLQIILTTPNSYQGTRQICAHSEGTILLRYALQRLHKSSYAHLSDSGFQSLIDQHFIIQLYGAPVKGAITPHAEDRNIPGDAVAATGRHLDRTNGDVISTPNKIDTARSLPAPGLDAHKMREHTARLPQFEAESMLQKAAGSGQKAGRVFVNRVKDGTLRHEIAPTVLEEILLKLSEPGMEKMRAAFCRELVLNWKDGWIGAFQVPNELQAQVKNT